MQADLSLCWSQIPNCWKYYVGTKQRICLFVHRFTCSQSNGVIYLMAFSKKCWYEYYRRIRLTTSSKSILYNSTILNSIRKESKPIRTITEHRPSYCTNIERHNNKSNLTRCIQKHDLYACFCCYSTKFVISTFNFTIHSIT